MRTIKPAAVILLGLVLVPGAWAADDDAQQIRQLFQTHWSGWYEADLEQILSTVTEDLVTYDARGGRPAYTWGVGHVGRGSFRDRIADQIVRGKAAWEEHEAQWDRGDEVIHIHIKADHALAVTYQWVSQPDEATNETVVNEWQSVWMLAKEKGVWKITGWVGQVMGDQTVYQ